MQGDFFFRIKAVILFCNFHLHYQYFAYLLSYEGVILRITFWCLITIFSAKKLCAKIYLHSL